MAKYALLIGIGEYEEGLDSLQSPIANVSALAEVLADPERGGFDEVTPLINCDRSTLSETIEMFFKGRDPKDLLLLFFSGHGVKNKHRELYFAATNTRKIRKELLETSALAAAQVSRWIKDSAAESQVVILDCCFSGAFGDLQAMDDRSVDVEAQLGAEGRVVLTSTVSTSYGFEAKDSELSIYSYYLVEGLSSGAADLDRDGYVNVGELHDFTSRKVQQAVPEMSPCMFGFRGEGHKILLARTLQTSDPTVEYRQEAEKRCRNGEFTPVGRAFLKRLQRDRGLADSVVQAIEAEILKPFRDYQENLREYREALEESLKTEPILSAETLEDLQDFQAHLGLREQDVTNLHDRLIGVSKPHPKVVEAPVQTKPDRIVLSLKPKKGGSAVPLELMPIPGGTFGMGQTEAETKQLKKEAGEDPYNQFFASELPRHQVTVPPFWMGKYPVTQAQYEAVMGENPTTGKAWCLVDGEWKPDIQIPAKFVAPDKPVVGVNWEMAVAFCEALSKLTEGYMVRLPSEAEWEYACRAGTETAFYFGDRLTPDQANFNGNYTYNGSAKGQYREVTTAVGQFPANAWGLYDMHGNVWEWCLDLWHENYINAPADGRAWTEQNTSTTARIVRGGSWFNYPWNCRSASRYGYTHVYRPDLIGFRVCCLAPRGLP